MRAPNHWREAVLDNLASTGMDVNVKMHPALILELLIAWHTTVALDKAVSLIEAK